MSFSIVTLYMSFDLHQSFWFWRFCQTLQKLDSSLSVKRISKKLLQFSYSFTEFKAAEQFPYNQQLPRIFATLIIHIIKSIYLNKFLRYFWIWINWNVLLGYEIDKNLGWKFKLPKLQVSFLCLPFSKTLFYLVIFQP